MKSFKDLNVWQKSVDLAVFVYKITEKFPNSEIYGITNQMRRAVISISSNLAEGFKRVHKKEKLQFYNIAYGSVAELESQAEVSKKLNFLSEKDYQILMLNITEISKMVNGLVKSLNSKSYILNSNTGFTLIELLITVAIVGVISIIGVVNFLGYRQRQDVNLTAQEIISVLREAQNKSISQEASSTASQTATSTEQWGVFFQNATSTADLDYYDLFWGASYSESNISSRKTLRSSVQFDTPLTGIATSTVFNPMTGLPVASTTIKISLISNASISSTIVVNDNGKIEYYVSN